MSSQDSKSKNFKNMSVTQLKEYLQNRGVSVSGYLKSALVEIAIAVNKMMLPLNTSFEEKNTLDNEKFYIDDMEIKNPFTSPNNLVNNFADSPPFGLYDIFNYLIHHSTEYDKQGLAAYKSLDEYRLFQDGYVESMLTETLSNERLHLYMGKVKPAMKDKTDEGRSYYECWFILEGKGANRGSVVKARCRCKGGRDGGCKHIAAAMYSLEDLLNTRDKDSPTSKPCVWTKRSTVHSKPCDVKDLPIAHTDLPLKKPKREHIYVEHISTDLRHKDDQVSPTYDALRQFTHSLESSGGNPAILPLLTKLYGEKPNCPVNIKDRGNNDAPKLSESVDETVVLSSENGLIKEKLFKLGKQLGPEFLAKAAAEDVLSNLSHSQEEVDQVSESTIGQWMCDEWYQQKEGLITGSVAQRVLSMQNSLDKGKQRDVSSLVKAVTCQKAAKNTSIDAPSNPRNWGLKHEESARQSYYKVECKKHCKLSLVSKGLMLSKKKPYVAASLDNIRSCSCADNCQDVVVEYKCPWKHQNITPKEAFLTPEIGGEKVKDKLVLKTSSRYYCQIQLQMFVAELENCDFVVWTEKGILTVSVPYDANYMECVLQKLEKFWINHVLPCLVIQKLPKPMDHIKAEAMDVDMTTHNSNDSPANENVVPQTSDITTQHDTDVGEYASMCKPDNEESLQLSIRYNGVDVYEACADTLRPQGLLNDNIVSVLLEDLSCEFEIISTFFYTVLCGEQEGNNQLSQIERNEKGEMFFPPTMIDNDYIFVPINRSEHWLLAVITPWHLIIMDSLTWDAHLRKDETNNILSFLEHLSTKFNVQQKHLTLSCKVLKVPQQPPNSNDCGIYISLFLKYFLQELKDYESEPDYYCSFEHNWFEPEEAAEKRTTLRKHLESFFMIQKYKMKYK